MEAEVDGYRNCFFIHKENKWRVYICNQVPKHGKIDDVKSVIVQPV